MPSGVDLSDEGRRQARRLGERLADDPIAAVYCSPLSRTVETAEIVARPHGHTLIRRDGLREISHGRWEGLTRDEVEIALSRGVPGLGGGSVHLRSRGRRVGPRASSPAPCP